MMAQPFVEDRPFSGFARLLIAPTGSLHIIGRQLDGL